MGTYINPGNQAFARIAGERYVDKTGLIRLMNDRVCAEDCLVCVSRPRRFGKSYAARMLAAYYDCSCDSHSLFDGRKIAGAASYEAHLNHYNVLYLDISGFVSEEKKNGRSLRGLPVKIEQAIRKDLREMGFQEEDGDTLNDALLRMVNRSGGKTFVFVIDEWDAPIREAREDGPAQEAYLNLLRSWFKNANFTPKVVAAAYMTGILPIKKDGSQSAISEFDEASMLEPLDFSEFIGFTEEEVRALCAGREVSFDDVKAWYDGYVFSRVGSVYNPYSVMKAVKTGKCQSYWRKTSAAESLKNYMNMDFDGLRETVARLIAGERIPVVTDGFQNDFETFESADDVLTLLIHLGYLTFQEEESTVCIPNEEVRSEFRQFLSQKKMSAGWAALIRRSQKLLADTVSGKAEEVAAGLDEIRSEQYAPQFYNNEQSLRAVIKYAYLAAAGQYVRLEEVPSGKGLADVVFLPASFSRLPAMVVELKWNRSAGGAINQIREKKYSASLKPYAGGILLVGINYNEKTGKHTCRIETG